MKPKILYAIQCTGNGHIIRANEIIPILKEYCDVDILVSGNNNNISLKHKINYNLKGLTLYTNKNGRLSYWKIFLKNYFINFIIDVIKLNVKKYDLIISDYEPISAWSSKFKSAECIGLSNQFYDHDKDIKRSFKEKIHVYLMSIFAPVEKQYTFGLNPDNKNILPPIIRNELVLNKNKRKIQENLYVVYLPSYSCRKLFSILKKVNVQWVIFSPEVEDCYSIKNCTFYPLDQSNFTNMLLYSKGVLTQAGFQLMAESLYLEKKLFVIPIKNHIEQKLNAKNLKKMGGFVSKKLDRNKLFFWVNNKNVVKVNFETNFYLFIENILLENLNEEVIEVKFI